MFTLASLAYFAGRARSAGTTGTSGPSTSSGPSSTSPTWPWAPCTSSAEQHRAVVAPSGSTSPPRSAPGRSSSRRCSGSLDVRASRGQGGLRGRPTGHGRRRFGARRHRAHRRGALVGCGPGPLQATAGRRRRPAIPPGRLAVTNALIAIGSIVLGPGARSFGHRRRDGRLRGLARDRDHHPVRRVPGVQPGARPPVRRAGDAAALLAELYDLAHDQTEAPGSSRLQDEAAELEADLARRSPAQDLAAHPLGTSSTNHTFSGHL